MSKDSFDIGRNADGTFSKNNSLGKEGRPIGSRNKATRAMEVMLDEEGQDITRKAIELAMAGAAVALRLCLERLIAPCRDRHVTVDLPPMTNAAGLAQASANIIEAVSQGEITPTEANRIMQLVEVSRRTIETEDLEKRIDRLEKG